MRQRTSLAICIWSAVALGGCQTLITRPETVAFEYQLVRGPLVLHSDFPLPEQHRLIDELLAARHRVGEKLGLAPSEEAIHIYLFGDEASYYDFLQLRFPGFQNRRAIFVETDVALSVYAHWGDHVAEDLRHEVVHGYLHATVPNLPLWLDEGLAEYFEVAHNRRGLNEAHLKLLSNHDGSKFDLARLEQLNSAVEMTQADYAESWAWVHFLLESSDDRRELLTDYLADLQKGTPAPTLRARLHKRLATPELTVAEHLHMLR
ncbi:MAG: DUF1570 domain-containing protein [Pirellulales bacterium]|nr:DUF1570 domain-containing protein [Pirellulales bacterium]